MIEGQASLTALLVTYARAVSHADPALSNACTDDKAQALLPAALRASLGLPTLLRRVGFGLVDHVALRTGLIDEAVSEAVASGIQQVVILGAGLDVRGNRLAALRDAIVFEVDHPDTQRLKRERVAGLGQAAKEIRYAACDFRDDALERSLRDAGHDPKAPTCFIWEGVTMYLPRAAIEQTLEVLRARSAPGSRLIVTYAATSPRRSSLPGMLTRLAGVGLALIGEPVRFLATKPELEALLAAHDYRVLSNVLPSAQAARFGVELAPLMVPVPERVVVAALATNDASVKGSQV